MATMIEKSNGFAIDDFVSIRLDTLELLPAIHFDLYLEGSDGIPRLYRDRNYSITKRDFEALRNRGVGSLHVSARDSVRTQEEMAGCLEAVLQSDHVPVEDRFGYLQTAVSVEIQQAFRMINVNSAVERSNDIGGRIATLLQGSGTVPSELFNVVQHDFYTFTHITNVAGYAVLLAENLGISDQNDLSSIATGALLHDVGKRLISPGILNKPTKLNDEEWKIIQSHPQSGYEELCVRDDLSFGQLMMVYQHHEKLDGSGYPVKATAREIHPWARLCAVVDIFDAMTCARPYRKPMKLTVVLNILEEMAGIQLDGEMVSCWISLMKSKPTR